MGRQDAKQKAMFYTARLSKEDILLCFMSDEEWLTRAQIAERLFRSKSPALITMIEALVDEGELERNVDQFSNGAQMFWYRRGG